jgi:hypothetical protein
MGWTTGFQFPAEAVMFFFFCSPLRPDRLRAPVPPPSQWVQEALISSIKRPGHEADHSLPYCAHVKNAWSPQFVFMARCLVKHRDNFTFTTFRYDSSKFSCISCRGRRLTCSGRSVKCSDLWQKAVCRGSYPGNVCFVNPGANWLK